MDETLHYLLHEELEGLFDLPAERAAQKPAAQAAPATGASATPAAATPDSAAAGVPGGTTVPPAAGAAPIDDLLGRLADPRVLQALAHLLGVR